MPKNNLPIASGVCTTAEIEGLRVNAENFKAQMEITSKMDSIVNTMRETPPPKSEVAQGQPTNRLLKVEFPPIGGVLTYMEGFPEPFQGFPFHDLVEKMDVVKKLTKGFKSGFHHLIWKYHKGWTRLPMILLTFPFIRLYIKAEIYSCWRYIERYKVKPTIYCTALREVHRAFSQPIDDNERHKTRVLREMMRDLFCMHLEFDNAYRFRFQDGIVELNKDNLKKNPIKEMLRIFNVVSDREVHQEVKDSWTLTKTMVEYLRYSREIKPIIISFLMNLDVEKCKLDKRDTPYCVTRVDYKFNFKK